jgi:hypothetical protein
VYNLLKPWLQYFSVFFLEKDVQFGYMGKFRKTQLETTLYFSLELEIRDLFSSYFAIKELKTIEIRTNLHLIM